VARRSALDWHLTRVRLSSGGVRLVLLTGLPATGKTTLGEHMATEHGFVHLDFEDMGTLGRFWKFDERGFRKQLAPLKTQKRDVVVTWGFAPDVQLRCVTFMRSLGFDWVWLDGDRDAAHRVFTARATASEEAWQIQMGKVNVYIDPNLDRLRPRIIDPFDAAGRLRPTAEVAAEVLDT
jgi:hypothetical protein